MRWYGMTVEWRSSDDNFIRLVYLSEYKRIIAIVIQNTKRVLKDNCDGFLIKIKSVYL